MATELVSNVAQAVGLSHHDVEQLISSAPRRYKEFQIKKRNDRGWRDIAQPSRELKAVQRFLMDSVLRNLPIHDCAHGYVIGRGIKSNAAIHVASDYLLKLDISDFFPSLRPADFAKHVKRHAPDLLTEEELKQVLLVLFWKRKGQRKLRLCIGAPSSPLVSNTLMFDLDLGISAIAFRYGVAYSRYADDMTFSCNVKGVLSDVQREVIELIHASRYPRLIVNQAKTVHISRAQRRVVTGVTISATRELSIGRERKREIRNLVHRHHYRMLTIDDQNKLNGLIGFAADIEPAFANKMIALLAGAARLGVDNDDAP